MELRPSTVTPPRPHDLLRLSDTAVDSLPADAPSWARRALTATPWVVVRRAAAPEVGRRGHPRAVQIPALRDDRAVRCRRTDRHTGATQRSRAAGPSRFACCPRIADGARRFLSATGLPWGPTGSVGFELATGAHTITRASDLDVVLRVDSVTPQVLQRLSVLHNELQAAAARVDCQIEMAKGAVTLADIVSSDPRVLVRSTDGPRLETVTELPR